MMRGRYYLNLSAIVVDTFSLGGTRSISLFSINIFTNSSTAGFSEMSRKLFSRFLRLHFYCISICRHYEWSSTSNDHLKRSCLLNYHIEVTLTHSSKLINENEIESKLLDKCKSHTNLKEKLITITQLTIWFTIK